MAKNRGIRLLSTFLSIVMLLGAFGGAAFGAEAFADGSYNGSGIGMGGAVDVAVTVEGGKITAIDVTNHAETVGISDPAFEQIPPAIIDAQSTDVDAVAGATLTSNAIKTAVDAALSGEEPVAAMPVDLPFDQADVIVIGAGFAGLAASVRAAELGGNVLLIEQSATVGGSAKVAGGSLVGVNTIIESENGLSDSPELLHEDFVRLGGEGNFNEELSRKFAESCGAAVDWLDTFVGVNFGDRVPTTGGYIALNVPRVHFAVPESGDVEKSSGQGGTGYIFALSKKLDEYRETGNACLMLDSRVSEVLSENGAVTGVKVTTPFGEEIYNAPSVIIATGGYGGNEAWLQEYNFANVASSAPATASGDGYDFARSLGAGFSGMDWCSAYAGAIPVTGFTRTVTTNLYTYLSPIWVTLDGNRMLDETTADSTQKSDVWTDAPENKVFVLYNEKMIEKPSDILYGATDADAMFEELLAKGEYLFKADTIEDLAAQAGIDAETLVATVVAYNEGVLAGEDSFGRKEHLIALDEGPFYAVMTIPYVLLTAGGPSMDVNAQLLREDGTPIGGAYICGEIVGSNNIAGHSSVGGMAHGNCVTWGRIAAESALANAGIELLQAA